MAYISSQVGPYAFFAVDRANGAELPFNSGIYVKDTETTGKKPKSIHVADGGALPKLVKQVWVNDAGTLRLVSPIQTVVLDLANGVRTDQGDYNANGQQTLDLRFTMNGSNVYLPVNWTGRISFWQGGSGITPNMTDPPTNAADQYGMGYFGTYQSSNHQSANSTAYQLLTAATGNVMSPLRGGFSPTAPATTANASWHPGALNGKLITYPAHTGMTIVSAANPTTYINTDGTPFSFNGYHSYTALAAAWTGIRWIWDGERSKGDTLRVQELRTLRMAVTSTSDIVPTYG